MPSTQTQTVSPPQLAKRWGVATDKVLALVRSGQLAAINLAVNPLGRPRYRIHESEVAAFEEARTTRPPIPRQRRQRPPTAMREFF